MKVCLSFIVFSLIVVSTAQSQSQADWWYFGNNAGVHFTSGGPVAVTNGQLSTNEGCSSISDPNGNLLLYTDGSTVYNSAHGVMPNGTGLLGNSSSTNSGVIVPRPGNSDQYYVISQNNNIGTGLNYSLVDLTLASGLGAVVAGQKNINLSTLTRENVTAVKHANGYDFWIVTHRAESTEFAAYLVTGTGINATPVVSPTNAPMGNRYGAIKISPDGKYVCVCSQNQVTGIPQGFKVGKFNTQTGQVTQAFARYTNAYPSTYSPYGVEFSPDSKVFYISPRAGSGYIWQYDISLYDSTTIISSETQIASGVATGAMQLGPDEKIYVATYSNSFLHCITSPNSLGGACGFVANAIPLGGPICRQGLPNFSPSWFNPGVEIKHLCLSDSTFFATADSADMDTAYWNFGDPVPFQNIAGGFEAHHMYSDTGLFQATLFFKLTGQLAFDSSTHEVHIHPHQTAYAGQDTTLCFGDTLSVHVEPQDYSTYLWSNGSTNDSINVYATGTYTVTVLGYCDTVSDAVTITFDQPFIVDLGSDETICDYDSITIDPNLSGSLDFIWSTGSNDSSIIVSSIGTYSVTVTNGTCTYSDDKQVSHYPSLAVDLGPDSAFCYTPTATLTPTTQNVSGYSWSNGATSPSISIGTTNFYQLTVTDGNGCFKNDSVTWIFRHDPIADLGNDTSMCLGDDIELNSGLVAPINFLWSTNETTDRITIDEIGLYWVEVSDQYCTMRDTVLIDQYPVLEVSLNEDVKTCSGNLETLIPESSDVLVGYRWSTGSVDSAITVSSSGTYKVTVTNGLCYAKDEINVFYFEYPDINLGVDSDYCYGTELLLDITSWSIVNYQWNDGTDHATRVIEVTSPMTLWASATNVVCTSTDTLRLEVHPDPEFELPALHSICLDSAIVISIASDTLYSYEWSDGQTSQKISVQQEGVYQVTASDGFCQSSAETQVVGFSRPEFELKAPEEICEGQMITLNPELAEGSVDALRWSDGSPYATLSVYEPGLYWLEASNECGSKRDSVSIIDCACYVRLPAAFHPSGDDKNETFGAFMDCDLASFNLSIFDRWGELMFETDDVNHHWDGTHSNKTAPLGSYVWKVKYTFYQTGVLVDKEFTGNVTLLR